jgi:hypothetical protein
MGIYDMKVMREIIENRRKEEKARNKDTQEKSTRQTDVTQKRWLSKFSAKIAIVASGPGASSHLHT